VPIHHTEGRHHWALMQLHQELKAMRCLDSFTTDKTEAVQVLAQYVRLERVRSAGGGMAEVWKPVMTSVPIPQQDAGGNACGPRTAISAMYLMQQDPEKIDAAESAEIMAPQYERSMRIFVVHCVITGHIPRKFGSAGVSNETTEDRASPDQEQGEQDPEQDLADEAFWDTGSEGSDLEATDPEESEEEEPETDQSGSEPEASLTEEPGSPEMEPSGRTPTARSDEQSGIKTKRRPKRRLDSDSEDSNCDDTSDEEAEDIVKELSQALEEADSEEERKSHGGRQDENKTAEGEDRAATADNSAPAARQSAQKVRAPAAGAGEANSDGEQEERGVKRPREEQATGADEKSRRCAATPQSQEEDGGVAQVPKSAEGGQRKRKAEGSDKLEHAESGVGAAESADAGPATANAEGGQRKRKADGPDMPAHADSDVSAAESIASGTTEGGAAAASKAEAEGGLQKTKRQRKMPRKRKKSAAPGRRTKS
jgi:hypothetical protein